MADQSANPNNLELPAEIVSAYVANNSLSQSELPALLHSVHDALIRTAAGKVDEPAPTLTPPVRIRKSVTPDYIVCLEDGKKFKSLKRHLRTQPRRTTEPGCHCPEGSGAFENVFVPATAGFLGT